MPVTSYSRTPSSNNSAPPNGAPEGMVFSAVNDTLRQMMADTVQEAAKGSARVLASVAGTNTITATMTPDLDAYTAGMMVVFTPAATNTGAVTLNIDSLGALDVQSVHGGSLAGGELVIGRPAVLVLDSGADDWSLLNSYFESGEYTPTFTAGTNVASATNGQFRYARSGGIVTVSGICSLTATAGSTGTPTASTFYISLPIASALTNALDISGTGLSIAAGVPAAEMQLIVTADETNDRARVDYWARTTSAEYAYLSFSYRIK